MSSILGLDVERQLDILKVAAVSSVIACLAWFVITLSIPMRKSLDIAVLIGCAAVGTWGGVGTYEGWLNW